MNHGRLINDGAFVGTSAAHRFDAGQQIVPIREWTSQLWLPEPFEPRYEYPLLIWLHDNGDDELTDERIANVAARQNMIVLSVRGTEVVNDGFGWPVRYRHDIGTEVWGYISEELAELPPELRFHSDRVFLAGRGSGALAAWRAWLSHGDRIAGAALVAPPEAVDVDSLRDAAVSSSTKPAISGRLWIGGSSVNSWRPAAQSVYALGAEVSLDPQATSAATIGDSLDRWVMRALPTAVFA